MKDLYIVGAGGMGREVLCQIQDMHAIHGNKWNIIGFLDDTESPLEGIECDYGVVGTIQGYRPKSNDALLLCIASPRAKRTLVPMLKSRGAFIDSFISPWASLGRHNTVGEGVIIYAGFAMTVNVSIGSFATLLAAEIGHDVVVGDYCTLSPRCGLMGHVSVGNGVFMGDSVRVAPKCRIGDSAYLSIGSVILRDVPPGAKMLGNPAREIGISDYM